MKPSGLAILGAALLATTAASAQTTVTREVSDMPVETTITTSPNGTVVTRRVLPATEVVREAVSPQSLYRTEMTTVRSTDSRRRQAERTRPSRVETRVVTTRRMANPAPVYAMARAEPLVLSADQRDVVYREIVSARAAPGPTGVLAPFSPLLPPAPPLTTRVIETGPAATIVTTPSPAMRTAYVVGSRLPADVRLIELPQTAVAQVPSMAPYAYAMVDDRVLLVDPQTGVIVADVTN